MLLASLIIAVNLSLPTKQITAASNKVVVWSNDRKLVLDDFQGKAYLHSPYDALSHTAILCVPQVYRDSVIFNIQAEFNSSKSWINPFALNDTTLNHEQIHFDITELFARKLKESFSNLKLKRGSLRNVYNQTYDNNQNLFENYQILYDHETDYGRNMEKQKEWTLKIAIELAALEKFKNPEVIILLTK